MESTTDTFREKSFVDKASNFYGDVYTSGCLPDARNSLSENTARFLLPKKFKFSTTNFGLSLMVSKVATSNSLAK